VLNDLSDAFKNMDDGADKAGLAMQIFGTRNAKQVAFFSQGAAALAQQAAEAERLLPTLDKISRTNLDHLADEVTIVGKQFASVGNSILAVFAPQLIPLVEAFTEAIAKNRDILITFASQIADKTKPIVQDFVALLQGRNTDIKGTFVLKARDDIVEFGVAAENAVSRVIVPAFEALLKVLDLTSKGINAVFDTNTSGSELAIIGVVGKVTGVFNVFTKAVSAANTILRLFGLTLLTPTTLIIALGVAIGAFTASLLLDFDGTTKKVKELWDALWNLLPTSVQNALAPIVSAVGSIASGAASAFDAVIQAITTAISTIGGLGNTIATGFSAAWKLISDGASAAWKVISSGAASVWKLVSDGASTAWKAIADAASAAAQAVVDTITKLPDNLQTAWQAVQDAASATWQGLQDGASKAISSVKDAFQSGLSSISQLFTDLRDTALGILQRIIDAAKSVASAVSSALSGGGASNSSDDGGGDQTFAGGGVVRGPGSSTSDSIPARLSNGEYVVQAKAVRHYGVPFLEAFNQMRVSLSAMGAKFSTGGFASSLMPPMPVPRFATGGLVNIGSGSTGHPVTLNIEGQSFGMTASTDTVAQLQRFSTGRQIRSAGRKPVWFKG
jgi:phage-related protein